MENKSPWVMRRISTRDIAVDPVYQRELEAKRVNQILDEYDPHLSNPIKVSFRNGKYYVFNGQHTIAVERARAGGKHIMIDCMVYDGLTELDEARLFVAQNGRAKQVSPIDKFRANANTGDPEAVDIRRILEANGFEVRMGGSKSDHVCRSINTVIRAYRQLGSEDFAKMVKVIEMAWGGHNQSLNQEIVVGLSIVLTTYGTAIDEKRLIKQLGKVNPATIIRDGRGIISGGNKRFARVILDLYNKGYQNKLEFKL